MNGMTMFVLASILLAANFGFTKVYQKDNEISLYSGMKFNSVVGFFIAILFLVINKFQVDISGYSVVMSILSSILVTAYTVLGFYIMGNGGLALYTFFLMTGGMVVPYIWGIVFLNEAFVPLQILGVIIIVISILLTNSGAEKPPKRVIVMCVLVFFINGFVSVVSKVHQISPSAVDSTSFIILCNVIKFALCLVSLIFIKNKSEKKSFSYKNLLLIIIISATGGISYFLMLVGAISIPATVLYPVVTGGSIILSTIIGFTFFKEKITKKFVMATILCFVGTLMFI